MLIFYNKTTGDTIGTVDGFGEMPPGMMMVPGGMDPANVGVEDIPLGHPQEQLARDLMDPMVQFPLNHEDLKFDHAEGQLRLLKDDEVKARDAIRAKQQKDHEDWLKKNPPRDLLAELDTVKAQLADALANTPKPPKA